MGAEGGQQLAQEGAGTGPPSKEEFAAALEVLKKHVESGGGLGKNEEGDNFVDILEEWDAGLQTLLSSTASGTTAPPPVATAATADTPSSSSLPLPGPIIEEIGEGDDLEDEDEYDEDAFEDLMKEIEQLELADEAATSRKASSSSGIKRGFLLGSTTSTSDNKMNSSSSQKGTRGSSSGDVAGKEERKNKAAAASEASSFPRAPSFPLRSIGGAFTGEVVERQSGVERRASSSAPPPAYAEQAQQRVSKFKQRQLQRP